MLGAKTFAKTRHCFQNLLLSKRFSVGLTEIIRIPAKKYYEVAGLDAQKFLQGLCTNDIRLLKQDSNGIAALFLNRQGRISSDTIIYDVGKTDTGDLKVIIETSAVTANDLASLLVSHRLRSKVTIKSVALATFMAPSTYDIKSVPLTVLSVIPDPRHHSFGQLILAVNGTILTFIHSFIHSFVCLLLLN